MIGMTVGEIARVVGGRSHRIDPQLVVTGKVEFDSRRVVPGDLFLAIKGEHADGHEFAGTALAAGAVAVLCTRELGAGEPDGGVPQIVVADPIAAITALAAENARRLAATVIEVTGSSGKTSTKDLLAQVLERHGRTIAPPESFNNELGFPYTVLLAGADTDYLVLEASARGLGHIAQLTGIAPPRIAAVLNVGHAHLGEFGSVAAIAQAKGELVEALPADGVAVLNADDPLVSAMAARTAARVVSVGEQPGADVRAVDVRVDGTGRASFTLVSGERREPVALQVLGEHQVGNALAAAAVALQVGMDLPAVAEALSAAAARSHWRMEVTEVGGVTVVNDAYNANPESVRAALKSLAIMAGSERTGGRRRSIAVLGQMAELGPESVEAHDAVGRLAVRLDVNLLLAVGQAARPIAHGASLEGSWNGESRWVPSNEAAAELLLAELRPGDLVLVKGSRSAEMQRIAHALIAGLRDGAGLQDRGQA
ncbi:MAG TPA: UDP-N-acetylmuramoyl-tripeptide--D-alanyl-D-alanine ligase [Jatrophihabitans sp.]|nr:UDP-N-acetylmuramoyl-tripeptide--D-alanyl-D-alanine ligase [Jatrophihabitans sp.]